MCQCENNPRILVENKNTSNIPIAIEGIDPITVTKISSSDTTKYRISAYIPNFSDGKDGADGNNGKDGISPTITINSVVSGTNAQVTNTGDSSNVKLNFVLPTGKDGTNGKDGKDGTNGSNGTNGADGKDGLVNGISKYLYLSGNESNSLLTMGTFSQGAVIDTGDENSKRLKIKAWVTVGNMRNWTTLKLTCGSIANYNGSTLIKQITKHSEGEGYVGEYEINSFITTSSRYIGFTFGDSVGGNYSSDGALYGAYGLEVFILT